MHVGGVSTHIRWVQQNGIYTQKDNIPFLSTIFWDTLTFLDVLAVILLIIRPKAGIILILIIMIADVFHNFIYLLATRKQFMYGGIWDLLIKNWMFAGQLFFLIIVICVYKTVANGIH